MSIALVAWAALSRRSSAAFRRASMIVAIVLGCAVWALLRTEGITGEGNSQFQWRWTPTPEERLLALESTRVKPLDASRAEAVGPSAAPSVTAATPKPTPAPPADQPSKPSASVPPTPRAHDKAPTVITSSADRSDPSPVARAAEWPGFRGPSRDSVVRGIRIETDWSASPPQEVWRRPIGPACSLFAVDGDRIYTQEQRGEEEVVSAYRLATGEPLWRHADNVRFWESNAGAGPRATPTVHNGRVYTMGATGILNALDANTGALIWSRNAVSDTGKTIPDWGIASSPLVIDDVVIAAVAGQLAAYDARTGQPRWKGQSGGGGYSSPHLATIDGVPQVLLLRGARTISVAPADGALLWEHSSGQPGVSIVQPAFTAEGDLLIATGDGMTGGGIRRLAVSRGPAGWTLEERWLSRGLKPYFNDFVVHNGHAFGFDGSILSCIDLANGERKWKGGRYGHGQMLLLPKQDLLLILSEDGELALVNAAPDRYSEVARFKAIEGKTWNHPVLVRDLLLVRNGEEMAAFRLSAQRMTRSK